MSSYVRAASLSCCALLSLLAGGSTVSAQTAQEHVHRMAHTVMPFDMAKTVHVFRMTTSGGEMRVVTRDASDREQIAMIQQHLRHEAANFQRGEFSDPATLHGADMPGLRELRAGASRISISYADLADGARITFETTDVGLLTAVHRWFGAQLSEHGADARSE